MARALSRPGLLLLLLLLLAGVSYSACDPAATGADPPATALLSQLVALRASLAAAGVDTQPEDATVAVGSFFLVAAANDTAPAQQALIARAYEQWASCAPSDAACTTRAVAFAATLPSAELSELSETLSAGIARARSALAAPDTRPPSPRFNASELTLGEGGYWRDATGAVRITGGFNGLDAGFVSDVGLQVGAGVTEVTLCAADALPGPNAPPPDAYLDALAASIAANAAAGLRTSLFVQHVHVCVPAWAHAAWPDFATDPALFPYQFIQYDPEHPAFRVLYGTMLGGIARALAARGPALLRYVHGVMLANEPAFENAGSRYTLSQFRTSLTATYGGDIAALNSEWHTHYAGFEDVPASALKPPQANVTLAQWYDWATFNEGRMTRWLAFMRSSLAPLPCHAKLVNEATVAVWWHHHGTSGDREALLALLDVAGCDTQMGAAGAYRGGRASPGTASQYLFSWLPGAASFDFQRSLAPAKAVYDSEAHYVNDSLNATSSVPLGGWVRPALWVAAAHGLSGLQMWFWSRGPGGAGLSVHNGNAMRFFPHSLLTSPAQLDAYGRALLELNMCSWVLAALQAVRGGGGGSGGDGGGRAVALLYSEAASIHDTSYLALQASAYEASVFLGGGVGYVTDAQLTAACPPPPAHQLLVIPGTSHVSNATFACLRARAVAGAPMLVVGNATAHGGAALVYDERGHWRTHAELAWVDALPHAPAPPTGSPVPAGAALSPALTAAAAAAGAVPPVRCMDAAATPAAASAAAPAAWGVLCYAVACTGGLPHAPAAIATRCAEEGSWALLMVNVRAGPAVLQPVGLSAFGAYYDVLTNTTTAAGVVTLAAGDVALLLLLPAA